MMFPTHLLKITNFLLMNYPSFINIFFSNIVHDI